MLASFWMAEGDLLVSEAVGASAGALERLEALGAPLLSIEANASAHESAALPLSVIV